MAQEKKQPSPDAQVTQPPAGNQVQQPSVIASREVLHQHIIDAFMNVNPATLIKPKLETEAVKGNAKPAGGWLHSPAHWQFYAAVEKRLIQCAKLDRKQMTRIERVHISLIPGTQLMTIKAADSQDMTAIAVTRPSGSGFWVNAFNLLGDAELTVEPGFRQRYTAHNIPQGSPLWPGLFIDISQPLERRTEPESTKKNAASANNTKNAAAGAKPAAEPAKTEAAPAPDAGAAEAK